MTAMYESIAVALIQILTAQAVRAALNHEATKMLKQLQHNEIKWGYCTHTLADFGLTKSLLDNPLDQSSAPPKANDVILAEVVEIGHHSRIELPVARPSTLFLGDIVGVAFGNRYATRQYEAVVPEILDTCHMLTVAGVCGHVVAKPSAMKEPTLLRPLGYLADEQGGRVNLRDYGLKPLAYGGSDPTLILVVGASMDSGKTTTAASVVNGLMRAGKRVCAGKLTGTGSAKDALLMRDAGALKILDFTDVGHASTARCSRSELAHIASTVISQLTKLDPDYIVLEIADGITQRETVMLLQHFQLQRCIDYVFYCCADSLGVTTGVEMLRRQDFNVIGVSGLVAYSALSAREAQEQTDLSIFLMDQLRDPAIAQVLVPRPVKMLRASASA